MNMLSTNMFTLIMAETFPSFNNDFIGEK